MMAAVFHRFGAPAEICYERRPDPPPPSTGEARIHIVAASVNPSQWKLSAGMFPALVSGFPYTPGHDFAGIIEAVGPDVGMFARGDRVVGYAKLPGQGSWADAITVPTRWIAPAPCRLSAAATAAFPTVALTAWESLFNDTALQAGETVMITAAAGGVGSIAVQLAKLAGARVIGVASASNFVFLESLGCDLCVDYRTIRLDALPERIDVAIDGAGGDTLRQCYFALRRGGRLSSLSEAGLDQALAAELGIKVSHPTAQASGEVLRRLVSLFDEGKLRVIVSGCYPMAQAGSALMQVNQGHVRGKLVLVNHPEAETDWPVIASPV